MKTKISQFQVSTKDRIISLGTKAIAKTFNNYIRHWTVPNRSFSPDVTEAILVYLNKETAVILVSQNNLRGNELHFYANISFSLSESMWPLVT